jgi:hypothetical protein
MSSFVDVETLRPRDLVELQNGSICVTSVPAADGKQPRVRLWCAHAPDAITFEPPLIELPAGQQVRLLRGDDAKEHYLHEGFVEAVFRREMDRRHAVLMQGHEEKRQREAAEQRQRQRLQRPWWKKLLG